MFISHFIITMCPIGPPQILHTCTWTQVVHIHVRTTCIGVTYSYHTLPVLYRFIPFSPTRDQVVTLLIHFQVTTFSPSQDQVTLHVHVLIHFQVTMSSAEFDNLHWRPTFTCACTCILKTFEETLLWQVIWPTFLQIFSDPCPSFRENQRRRCCLLKFGGEWGQSHGSCPRNSDTRQVRRNLCNWQKSVLKIFSVENLVNESFSYMYILRTRPLKQLLQFKISLKCQLLSETEETSTIHIMLRINSSGIPAMK